MNEERFPTGLMTVRTVVLCLLAATTTSLFGQGRDYNAERFILDDGASDGTRNTLTLQVPGVGLTGNRTLTLPDGSGFILTTPDAIVADQILFGNASGQIDQNPDLMWDDANSIFGVGDGAFSVDGVNNVTEVGGELVVLDAISDPFGDLTIDDILVPAADNTYSLGTDDVRWSDVFVNGGSVHIGSAGSEAGSSEMTLGIVGIVGEVNILGGNPELLFNGDAVEVQFDSDGDGVIDAAVTGGGIRVNSGAGANAIYAEDGISRNGGANETFDFSNSGGDLDVTVSGDFVTTGTVQSGSSIVIDGTTPGSHSISTSGAEDLTIAPGGGDLVVTGNTNVTGSLDIDTDLNVDGSTTLNDPVSLGGASGDAITLNGTLIGLGNGHSLGTIGTDATVITIQGLAGGVSEFVVAGDAEINGALSATTLSTGSLTLGGNLDMNQNDITDVGTLVFTMAASQIDNTAGDVTVNDNLVVTGTSDLQGAVANSVGDVAVNDNLGVTGDLDAAGVTTLGGATAVTNSRLTVDDGHWTSQQTTAPTAAAAGANVTSATLSNETDVAGSIDITSSGTPAAGAQATVTFDAAYNTAPIVHLTPVNGQGAGIGAYVTSTTTDFTINFIGVPAVSTSYQFNYLVIETQ